MGPFKAGVLEGLVLGPHLLIIYINALEEGTQCNVSRFTNDKKAGTGHGCNETS